MGTSSLLADAIHNYTPTNMEAPGEIMGLVKASIRTCSTDEPTHAEALLSCLLEASQTAGEQGKEVLDDLLLELMPAVASVAQHSPRCIQLMSAFCSLVAVQCSARECITAFLEVLYILLDNSPEPDTLQLACSILLMLPQQVSKLKRRQVATALSCCAAAASVAKAHGSLLDAWSAHQLMAAAERQNDSNAGQSSVVPFDRLDTFLATNWQAYSDFVAEMVRQVLLPMTGTADRDTLCQGLSAHVLQLLHYLTATWQPTALQQQAWQILAGPPQLLPSTSSVAAPALIIDSLPQRQPEDAQQLQCSTSNRGSATEAVVAELLHVLSHGCHVESWPQLPCQDVVTAAGAALSALYSCCIQDACVLTMPASATETIQLACRWCRDLAGVSDMDALAIFKCVALLQLAAVHAKASHDGNAAGQVPTSLHGSPSATGDIAAADHDAQAVQANASKAVQVDQLLPDLQPCISLLAGVRSSAPAQALRTQASLALQQVLHALNPPVCQACLRELLCRDEVHGGVHPEVAAILMQEVRVLLANHTGSIFNSASSVQLVSPWLVRDGPVGWQSEDDLPDNANAVCAALAVVRLALLSSKAAPDQHKLDQQQLQQLKTCLDALSAAVAEALMVLQALKCKEPSDDFQHPGGDQQGPGGAPRPPPHASGAGQAVDTWLAVSRVQDVLDRVLELI